MRLRDPHLDDAAFADAWTEQATSGGSDSGRPVEIHLRSCADCRARYAEFCGWLDMLRADAIGEADEALSAERLAAQQAQILRRIEASEQPARVIAFPRFTQPISVQPGGRRHWIAAAAAAGLVVGLGLGQFLEFGGLTVVGEPGVRQEQQIARGSVPAGEGGRSGLQPIFAQASDEAYLYDQDLVPSQVRVPESLQYLNAITPSARDYDPR